ncbi:MAG: prephenate dehydrogenase [Clostridia bacterium]|nr:prephenate dehydrogenase [Clostridia bacterium]
MELNKKDNILIVGLGLIGGSYAKALKNKGFCVSAIDTDRDTVGYARKMKIADYVTDKVETDLIAKSNLIIFALYPHIFVDWIKEYGNLISYGTIITDVTGVKGIITEKIQSMLPNGVEFIAAHPMAGKEHLGIENSDPNIFCGANYLVVPTKKNTENAIQFCKSLGETLGFSNIAVLSTEEHDNMIAFLSQLTHCIAVSLMCADDNEHLSEFTGDSFRDLTRIADINDEMWSGLFLDNKEALLFQMEKYRSAFDELFGYIKNNDRNGIRNMMKISSKRRQIFNKKEE